MDADFWHDRWAKGEIGFHQLEFNAHMQAYTQLLGLAGGANILVPLCGKSRDMLWLAGAGFGVTGIEISQRAVEAFFAENGLAAEVEACPGASLYRSGEIGIWCADFFWLDPSRLPAIDAVYDRAALVALPPGMRVAYAGRLTAMLEPGTPVLLLTFDYPQAEMAGPPFSVPSAEVLELFGSGFDIEPIHSENCLDRERRFREKGLTRLVECVHILRKRQPVDC